MRLGPPAGAHRGLWCLAWSFPADVSRPPPPPAPLLAWGMPRDCLAVGLSHPLPLNFLPTPRPFCPHVQRPRPLGLEFSRDPPWALTPGLAEGQSSALKPCSAVFPQACGVPTAPSPFAVLFALTGRQVSVPWTDAVGGAWSCVWAGGRSGPTSAASVAEATCSAVDSLCTLSVFVG